jgi:hypothetical protein
VGRDRRQLQDGDLFLRRHLRKRSRYFTNRNAQKDRSYPRKPFHHGFHVTSQAAQRSMSRPPGVNDRFGLARGGPRDVLRLAQRSLRMTEEESGAGRGVHRLPVR